MKQLTIFDQFNDYTEHKKYTKGRFKSKKEILELAKLEGKTVIYKVLSFGGGVKSAHLLEEHLKGNIDYDFIVFADTGAEPQAIHKQVAWWKKRQKKVGNTTPFIVATHNSMTRGLEEMLMRYIFTDYQRFQMPLYFSKLNEEGEIKPAGMMRKQCTADFKIIPVQQAVRNLIKEELGLRKSQPMPRHIGIVMDLGYGYDELKRVNGHVSHQSKYIYLAYPLIEEGYSTQDSIQYLAQRKLPSKRSRFYFFPYNHTEKEIGVDLEGFFRDEPISFLKACFFDEQLRSVQATGIKNMNSIPFFHRSRKPLVEVYAEQYQVLSVQYETEMKKWTAEWAKYLQKKYGAHRLNIFEPKVTVEIIEEKTRNLTIA